MHVLRLFERWCWRWGWGWAGQSVDAHSAWKAPLLGMACWLLGATALGQLAVPELSAHVIDNTQTLKAPELAQLKKTG